jgi:hypothetical protein
MREWGTRKLKIENLKYLRFEIWNCRRDGGVMRFRPTSAQRVRDVSRLHYALARRGALARQGWVMETKSC